MASPENKLRRIVACQQCGMQYDATGRDAGSRFRCVCGTLVTVNDVLPHDAAVVRCSSCGGPRQHGARACTFCSADFTLHERDLQTMCPGCMSRIGDRARYCHACGLPIVPQGTVGSISEHHCPVCGEAHRLFARNIDDGVITVLECDRCAGIWVGHRIFKLLESRVQQDIDSWGEPPKPGPPRATEHPGGSFYRGCVECGKLMHRRNFGKKSGVIVDMCREHGIWFDLGELEDILGWIQAGGHQRVAAAAEGEPRRWSGSPPVAIGGSAGPGEPFALFDFGAYLIDALIDFVSRR